MNGPDHQQQQQWAGPPPRQPQQPQYMPQRPTSGGSGTTALWVIAGVIFFIAMIMLFGPDCGKKQAPQQQPKQDTMTVRMRVRNPHIVALERNAKLERDKKALAEKLAEIEKQRLKDLKDNNKALKEKNEELQKKIDALKKASTDAERDQLKKEIKSLRADKNDLEADIQDLKRKLKKKPKVIVHTRTKVIKTKAGENTIAKELRALKKGQKKLHKKIGDVDARVRLNHPSGQGPTPTGGMNAGQ